MRRDTQWRDEWSTWGKDGDRKWVTMTRRKQVSDRLQPPAQPMMRKEPVMLPIFHEVSVLFRSSFSCLGSSGSLLSLPLRLTSLTLLAPLIIRAAGEWNEPKGTKVRGARQGTDMIGEGSSHCVALASVPFPRSLSSLRRSVRHALEVRSSRRSLGSCHSHPHSVRPFLTVTTVPSWVFLRDRIET